MYLFSYLLIVKHSIPYHIEINRLKKKEPDALNASICRHTSGQKIAHQKSQK